MLPDSRLWAFTAGVRGRIVLAVAVGLAAALVRDRPVRCAGVAPRRGSSRASRSQPSPGSSPLVGGGHAAPGMARILAQHDRAPHRRPRADALARAPLRPGDGTGSRPGSGWNERGEVLVSLVEGVEQLETWFGPVPAPALCGRTHPDHRVRLRCGPRPAGRPDPARIRALHPGGAGCVHPLGPRQQAGGAVSPTGTLPRSSWTRSRALRPSRRSGRAARAGGGSPHGRKRSSAPPCGCSSSTPSAAGSPT